MPAMSNGTPMPKVFETLKGATALLLGALPIAFK